MTRGRQACVVAHRWAGLTIAFFLCVAALTGSLIAWNHELERLTAPAFFVAEPPTPGAPTIDPLALRARVETMTGAQIDRAPLRFEPGEAALFYPKALPGRAKLDYNELAVNPYTGTEQGRRRRGDLSQGWHNIMPFIYSVHHELALGEWMSIAFGVAALIWTFDCFVGFFLTLPPARPGRWRRWRRSWKVRTPVTNRYKLNVDFHTAAGLWLWPILLVFAWTAVGFNLRDQVYDPVMTALTGKRDMFAAIEKLPEPNVEQRMDWPTALAQGRAHAAALASRHGFSIKREGLLTFNRAAAVWQYRVRSDRDVWGRHDATRILFRDDGGGLSNYQIPSGHHPRETIDNWMVGLHMGLVLGLPYRIFVSVLGLLVTGLAVTGVIIWMKKRSARIVVGARSGAVAPIQAHPQSSNPAG